jgi:hypothetical protein
VSRAGLRRFGTLQRGAQLLFSVKPAMGDFKKNEDFSFSENNLNIK